MNDKHMDEESYKATYWNQEWRENQLASGDPSDSFNFFTIPSYPPEPTALFQGEVS